MINGRIDQLSNRAFDGFLISPVQRIRFKVSPEWKGLGKGM
jgi:hypothetical protein